MTNLNSKYLGLSLKSPLVVSANPLSQEIGNILSMEDNGAGAVVLFSLFEEQIRAEALKVEEVYRSTTNPFAETSGFFPELENYAVGTGQYLEIIRQAKERVDIPVIASLNGITPEGWIEYAKDIEQAGADALEINVYFIPADIRLNSEEVEQRYLDILKMVKSNISIPVAMKLNPYFSSIGNMAKRLSDEGANGLVLFNRFYQPDFDIERLKVLPNLDFSHPAEIRLPLLWIAVLYGRLPVSLAATTGVHGAEELIKYILAGADVGMCASVLYKHGIQQIKVILQELQMYMEKMQFKNIEAFKGAMSQLHVSDPSAYERGNYIQILEDKKWR
ncbi:MAG: dihydroorotate dehydrogenase-like protein [Saprospiraceae bacterium]|nr:dihydroorotate dehydrogenase-like protein [Saprospiraceae bacterium]MBK6783055.1 dihydroorotate dehydrogenase-like protein [Saprospiraceae bacterium]MBK7523549.1 dihydroorotate dehydrogenase-like protein [Saprospiraceae bacterium]MBK9041734.1 dihydroorotate dehydrogenase-like protein [Saprospiraceae bacterium]